MIGAIDAAAGTLVEADALAGVVCEIFADGPGRASWVATHWIEHDPAVGGAHLAVSVEAELGAREMSAALGRVAQTWAASGHVYAAPAEIGIVVDGSGTGLPGLVAGAGEAARRHAARESGRLVHYPGAAAVAGELTAGALVDATAVDALEVVGGEPVAADVPVLTFGYARPLWRDGAVRLLVMPYAGGRVTPYEVRSPTQCCADH